MSKVDEILPFNFPSKKPLEVEFSALDLSSDAGLLLIKQAETNLQICQGITNCLEEKENNIKFDILSVN